MRPIGVQHLSFPVQGLSCPSTAAAVERALCRIPGVLRAAVNPVTQTVYVDYHPEVPALRPILAVLRQFGLAADHSSR